MRKETPRPLAHDVIETKHAHDLVRISYPFQPPPSKFNFTLIRDRYGLGAESERSFENYFANLKRIVIVDIKVIE